MSSDDKLREIAEKAEHDLNTYQAKTGRARGHDLEDASGVDSRAPKKFPGADLRYGDDLITNASYDRPIPPEEGGVVDKMHHISSGRYFEGPPGTGPEDIVEMAKREHGGDDDPDVEPESVLGPFVEVETKERRGHSPLEQGIDSREHNLGERIDEHLIQVEDHHGKGQRFPGPAHEEPELDAEGNIQARSAVEKPVEYRE